MGKSSGEISNRIKEVRENAGFTLEALAHKAGLSPSYLSRMENGGRNVTLKNLEKLANGLGVPVADLVPNEASTVPVVGYVKAGAETILFSEGQIDPEDRVPAPEGATANTVAVEIRGESLGALFDQWLVFYDDVRDHPNHGMINKLCVCWLVDGRVLVKKLTRGNLSDSWTLLSNTEAPIYDVFLERAARVRNMAPR